MSEYRFIGGMCTKVIENADGTVTLEAHTSAFQTTAKTISLAIFEHHAKVRRHYIAAIENINDKDQRK